jgi:hypothetical protein
MSVDVPHYCERWARWAHGARGACQPVTGKLMGRLVSTLCPTCSGRTRVEGWKVGSTHAWVAPCPDCGGTGKVDGSLEAERGFEVYACRLCDARGKFMGETCFRCAGRKKYRIATLKINPAGIRSTRYAGANEDDDPVSMLIDRTISFWRARDSTFWFGEILVMEYTENGTQEAKARSRRLSQVWYTRTLRKAHELLEDVLKNNFERLRISY